MDEFGDQVIAFQRPGLDEMGMDLGKVSLMAAIIEERGVEDVKINRVRIIIFFMEIKEWR